MATLFERSEKNVANLSDVIAGAWGCEIPNKFCPLCVHRAKLALLFATYPEHIYERSEFARVTSQARMFTFSVGDYRGNEQLVANRERP